MQDAILKLVQARLKGPYGIKRYARDSYFCQDYDERFSPNQMSSDFSDRLHFRDAFLEPNCEAQWCILDPLLSIIYGFSPIPRTKAAWPGKFTTLIAPSLRSRPTERDGKCPELYFLKQGRYVPNAHTPLAWTQANQALALHVVKKSVEVSR